MRRLTPSVYVTAPVVNLRGNCREVITGGNPANPVEILASVLHTVAVIFTSPFLIAIWRPITAGATSYRFNFEILNYSGFSENVSYFLCCGLRPGTARSNRARSIHRVKQTTTPATGWNFPQPAPAHAGGRRTAQITPRCNPTERRCDNIRGSKQRGDRK